jgi:tRNA threonylcarbamoyl adenosine modification protein (Sua5/YciO/YrdC/YwlC family)
MEKGIETREGEIDTGAAAEIIREGGVAVLPTDTIYGLHADARNETGIERVVNIKGKGEGAVFVLLASDIFMADLVVASWENDSRELLSSIWPAPLTALLKAGPGLNRYISKNGKVAVRIPDYRWLRELVGSVGYPVISTSVNRYGEPPLNEMSKIKAVFDSLELYVNAGSSRSAAPSTIIDFTEYPPLLIREGAFRPEFRVDRQL